MISQSDLRWKRCDIKSTNLLANVLASEAARRAGCHEAVLIDSGGFRDRSDSLVACSGIAKVVWKERRRAMKSSQV